MANKLGAITQALATANPWWQEPQWAKVDPDLVKAFQWGIDYRPPCLDNLAPGGLYILFGPRLTGKTVAIKRKISDLISSGISPSESLIRRSTDGMQINCVHLSSVRVSPEFPKTNTATGLSMMSLE